MASTMAKGTPIYMAPELKAIIEGTNNLEGAELMSSDLRVSVALVLAAFISRGTSIINRVYHLDRGYEKIENKLKKIGVKIKRIS